MAAILFRGRWVTLFVSFVSIWNVLGNYTKHCGRSRPILRPLTPWWHVDHHQPTYWLYWVNQAWFHLPVLWSYFSSNLSCKWLKWVWINIKMPSHQYRKSHLGFPILVKRHFILNRGLGHSKVKQDSNSWTLGIYLDIHIILIPRTLKTNVCHDANFSSLVESVNHSFVYKRNCILNPPILKGWTVFLFWDGQTDGQLFCVPQMCGMHLIHARWIDSQIGN